MKHTLHLHCPACGRATPHAVYRERLLAAVHWCQRCFQVTIGGDEAPAAHGDQAPADIPLPLSRSA